MLCVLTCTAVNCNCNFATGDVTSGSTLRSMGYEQGDDAAPVRLFMICQYVRSSKRLLSEPRAIPVAGRAGTVATGRRDGRWR
jgi:hypothetical protein